MPGRKNCKNFSFFIFLKQKTFLFSFRILIRNKKIVEEKEKSVKWVFKYAVSSTNPEIESQKKKLTKI